MVDRVFVKLVFYNNSFNSDVDVLSLPILSTILSSFEFSPQSYIRYERGSDYPDNLRYTNPRLQFELFEFAYQCYTKSFDGTTTTSHSSGSSTGSSSPIGNTEYSTPGSDQQQRQQQRKRKYVNILRKCHRKQQQQQQQRQQLKSTFINFQKEIAWCLVKNARILSRIGNQDNRYCYVNTRKNISTVATCLSHILRRDGGETIYTENYCGGVGGVGGVRGGTKSYIGKTVIKTTSLSSPQSPSSSSSSSSVLLLGGRNDDPFTDLNNLLDTTSYNIESKDATEATIGYMKLFSGNTKHTYISSLNYRNLPNLYNHIIVYFDVLKYFQLNSENIFQIPLHIQIQCISDSLALAAATTTATTTTTTSSSTERKASLMSPRKKVTTTIPEFLPNDWIISQVTNNTLCDIEKLLCDEILANQKL